MIIVIQISVYNIRSKGTIPLASSEVKIKARLLFSHANLH